MLGERGAQGPFLSGVLSEFQFGSFNRYTSTERALCGRRGAGRKGRKVPREWAVVDSLQYDSP